MSGYRAPSRGSVLVRACVFLGICAQQKMEPVEAAYRQIVCDGLWEPVAAALDAILRVRLAQCTPIPAMDDLTTAPAPAPEPVCLAVGCPYDAVMNIPTHLCMWHWQMWMAHGDDTVAAQDMRERLAERGSEQARLDGYQRDELPTDVERTCPVFDLPCGGCGQRFTDHRVRGEIRRCPIAYGIFRLAEISACPPADQEPIGHVYHGTDDVLYRVDRKVTYVQADEVDYEIAPVEPTPGCARTLVDGDAFERMFYHDDACPCRAPRAAPKLSVVPDIQDWKADLEEVGLAALCGAVMLERATDLDWKAAVEHGLGVVSYAGTRRRTARAKALLEELAAVVKSLSAAQIRDLLAVAKARSFCRARTGRFLHAKGLVEHPKPSEGALLSYSKYWKTTMLGHACEVMLRAQMQT